MKTLLFFTILAMLLFKASGSTNHGQLCPSVVRTIQINHHTPLSENFELFSFVGAAGHVISLSVERTTAAMDPIMYLWGPSGVVLAIQDDDVDDNFDGPFGDPRLSNFILPTSGTFLVGVANSNALPTGKLEFAILLTGSTPCCTGGSKCTKLPVPGPRLRVDFA
eukprot:TRINITY_DN7630_c0_g1_i1.p1 TRINITY_DN7630_c0_g1~~TRINITY_DN7630_c0_g1_i1.p1  ORF type:complete len:165 (+),score=14.13 TRINITY_DN7630_c0_g1_i1:278-772(+)